MSLATEDLRLFRRLYSAADPKITALKSVGMPGMNQCRPLFLLIRGGLERFGTGTDLGRCWCEVSHASLQPPHRPHCSVWGGSFGFEKYLCKTKFGHFFTKTDPILRQENVLRSLRGCAVFVTHSSTLTFCMSQALHFFSFFLF